MFSLFLIKYFKYNISQKFKFLINEILKESLMVPQICSVWRTPGVFHESLHFFFYPVFFLTVVGACRRLEHTETRYVAVCHAEHFPF